MLAWGSRAGVAEWQTRRTQNPLAARPCGFDSLLRHQELFQKTINNRDLPGIFKLRRTRGIGRLCLESP